MGWALGPSITILQTSLLGPYFSLLDILFLFHGKGSRMLEQLT